MTKSRKDQVNVESSDSEQQVKVEKKLKKDKKDKKDKKQKKDKKDKKEKKEKTLMDLQHPEILVHDDAGSDVKKEDDVDSVASGEFVAEAKEKNADYKDLLFGEKIRTKSGMSDEEDATVNYLNQRPYGDKYFKLLETRKKLPAWQAKKQIIELVTANQVLVLQGDTGSGKTTQVPQFILESGLANGLLIACTQPRRVAAMSVAERVASEMDVPLGEEVGYTIRFEDKTSTKTQLKYCTDGMLLRESMFDPELTKYGCIILDEAHERSLATDILFGLIKQVLLKRKDLKVVVMSATLNAERFQKYFEGAPLLDVPGRMYPVEIFYSAKPETDYLNAAVRTCVQIHQNEAPGDILLFLTGEEEIEQAATQIREDCRKLGESVGNLLVVTLYSSLPPNQQQKIFAKAPEVNRRGVKGRKLVISTNIAETSLTIDGIVYVVDPGFSKQKVYNPRLRVESLLVSPISRANCKQRAGRAGRTRPGKCYRLFTERSFEKDLQENTYPEILRSNLSNVILQLKKLGIDDIVHFDYMDPPAPETLMRGLEQLNYLGALDDEGNLTEHGEKMAEFPLDPQLSKMIITASDRYYCNDEIFTICALISVPQIFMRPRENMMEADSAKRKFVHQDGDHLTLLNAYNAFIMKGMDADWAWNNFLNARALKQASSIRNQLVNMATRQSLPLRSTPKSDPEYFDNIKKCLLSGFYMQAAHLERGGHYLTLKDEQVVMIHPSTVLDNKPQWIMYNEFVLTSRNYVRTVTHIRPEWLFEMSKDYFDLTEFKNSEGKKKLERILQRTQS